MACFLRSVFNEDVFFFDDREEGRALHEPSFCRGLSRSVVGNGGVLSKNILTKRMVFSLAVERSGALSAKTL